MPQARAPQPQGPGRHEQGPSRAGPRARRDQGTAPGRRLLRECGYATVELVAGIALLLLPVTLIVLTLPTWAERQSLAASAAHDAALALARSSTWPSGKARAEQILDEMARNYGLRSNERVQLTWEPDREGAAVERGEKVTAVVSVPTPGVYVPGLGSIGHWDITARHTEIVDRYRSL